MENEIVVTNKDKLDVQHKNEHPSYEYRKFEVPKTSEKSKFQIAFYEIPPNKSNYPFHYHLRDEEAFYIIKGKGLLKTCDSEILVQEGDVIVCPPTPQGVHMLTNIMSDENLVYIEFDITHYPEIIKYPNSDKIGIFEEEGKKAFYKSKSTVEYYTDE
ncbi:cupin domain-containing protein [Acetivibrio mesophilus]|uniref:Cupin domain-containing protein n=1 Tax=Acetivibrio mesophilus TaxID=2487273 RepID=A0A4Q0I867_9FIRM|nr:cupin domain-containing protein [Acetivibrio mesophilus]ODM26300.1 hypothetical protein A7W90_08715 [Clostridium sp. Bc-iso-3]RXE60646.1 cupin domain-containing protein [Acetivibrio mesophilus]HHV28054.1 cupin domain-containing protein [Clostridium sp.]